MRRLPELAQLVGDLAADLEAPPPQREAARPASDRRARKRATAPLSSAYFFLRFSKRTDLRLLEYEYTGPPNVPSLATGALALLAALVAGSGADAVVADYRLGDALGTEVVEAIRRAAGWRVPAIVVTGSSSESLHADLARHGLTHLAKPIAPARLRAALHEILRPDRNEDPHDLA